jgi:DNA repair protein RadC
LHQGRFLFSRQAALFAFKGGESMKESKVRNQAKAMTQQDLFQTHQSHPDSSFVSVYRVSLVKDAGISFDQCQLCNSKQAHDIIRKLIETRGQPDREQFCVILLNAKNDMIGLNIVSTGALSSAPVHPREVLKPAILANAAALIMCHNHPSNDLQPSTEDMDITKRMVQAAGIIGIQIHEHLIISLEDERYFSFADNGLIQRFYDEVT